MMSKTPERVVGDFFRRVFGRKPVVPDVTAILIREEASTETYYGWMCTLSEIRRLPECAHDYYICQV